MVCQCTLRVRGHYVMEDKRYVTVYLDWTKERFRLQEAESRHCPMGMRKEDPIAANCRTDRYIHFIYCLHPFIDDRKPLVDLLFEPYLY